MVSVYTFHFFVVSVHVFHFFLPSQEGPALKSIISCIGIIFPFKPLFGKVLSTREAQGVINVALLC